MGTEKDIEIGREWDDSNTALLFRAEISDRNDAPITQSQTYFGTSAAATYPDPVSNPGNQYPVFRHA